MSYKLKIIIGSVRPSRQGHLVAAWFTEIAKSHSEYDIEVLDLKEIDLPLMDEPAHPRLKSYTHDHTKAWSRTIEEADAYVFVTPEYNYSFPASLKNALDYLFSEWYGKPVAFVSYGGISGGMRAVQELKNPITTLGMMPLPQAVNIPFFAQYITDGNFIGDKKLQDSANAVLSSLKPWTEALKVMREKQPINT